MEYVVKEIRLFSVMGTSKIQIHIWWICSMGLNEKGGVYYIYGLKHHYHNKAQCNIILPTALQWLNQNINQILDSRKDTLYLTLTSELWIVCCEDVGEKSAYHDGTTLYLS